MRYCPNGRIIIVMDEGSCPTRDSDGEDVGEESEGETWIEEENGPKCYLVIMGTHVCFTLGSTRSRSKKEPFS